MMLLRHCKCFSGSGDEEEIKKPGTYRNLIAFWLLGLCTNYAYYIMLSAAHDILDQEQQINSTLLNTTLFNISTPLSDEADDDNGKDCNKVSTGVILMASVIPSLLVKFIAPFITSHITLQMVLIILMNIGSFIMVSITDIVWMTYTGVVMASISGGLGEVTILKLQTIYAKNSLSAFSSGSGFSGFIGSFSYAGITASGLTPRNTLLVMTAFPVIMAITYFLILVPPSQEKQDTEETEQNDSSKQNKTNEAEVSNVADDEQSSFAQRLQLMKMLLPKYIIPLTTVYFCQYFINQGLFELMYFRGIWLTHEEQYRWYQVVYQFGVFLAKSSVDLLLFNRLWMLSIFQLINTAVCVSEAYLQILPTIWISFALILWEGMVGGCSYVSTYFKLSQEVEGRNKQFAIAMTSLWETLGVVVASFLAIPVHQLFCQIPLRNNIQ